MSELRKAKKKLLAVRRAERRLRNRLGDIDWEEEVLLPEVEELNHLAALGKIPQYELEPGEKSEH